MRWHPGGSSCLKEVPTMNREEEMIKLLGEIRDVLKLNREANREMYDETKRLYAEHGVESKAQWQEYQNQWQQYTSESKARWQQYENQWQQYANQWQQYANANSPLRYLFSAIILIVGVLIGFFLARPR
jgi:hypothetical protein